jgi:hypothetical protein
MAETPTPTTMAARMTVTGQSRSTVTAARAACRVAVTTVAMDVLAGVAYYEESEIGKLLAASASITVQSIYYEPS